MKFSFLIFKQRIFIFSLNRVANLEKNLASHSDNGKNDEGNANEKNELLLEN